MTGMQAMLSYPRHALAIGPLAAEAPLALHRASSPGRGDGAR
jgi:hypothetical protein